MKNPSHTPRIRKGLHPSLLSLAAFGLAVSYTHAATLTWDGNANYADGASLVSGTWGTANLWNGDGANASWNSSTPDNAVFGGNTAYTVTLGANATAKNVTISGQGVTIDTTSATSGGPALTLTGTLTVTGSGATAIKANLTGAGAVVIDTGDSGSVNLTGYNNFSGGVTLNSGTLQAAGSGSGISNGTYNPFGSGTLTINGGSIYMNMYGTGNSTPANAVVIGGNFSGVSCGLAGTVDLSGGIRTIYGLGTGFTLGGVISNGGINIGGGTVSLTGTASTFAGGVTLSDGATLMLSGTGYSGTAGAPTSGLLGSGTLTINGGTLKSATAMTIANAVLVNNDFTINVNNGILSGGIDLGGGVRTITQMSTNGITFSGAITNGGINFANPTGAGTGSITISNTNSTFAGGLTVGAGMNLTITGNSTQDASGAVINGPIGTGLLTINDNANINPSGSIYNAVQLNGNLRTNSTSGTLGGAMSLSDGAHKVYIGNSYSASAITFSGAISGNAGMEFLYTGQNGNAGTVSLTSGSSTFGGGVTVNPGITLKVSGSSTVSGGVITQGPLGTGTLTINKGATIAMIGTGSVANNVVINGDFFVSSSSVVSNALSGAVDIGSEMRTITLLVSYGGITFSGPITGSGGLNIVSMAAAGASVALSGTNTYTGATVISNNGQLTLNTNASLGAASAVTVSNGGLLYSAGGTVNGSITVSNGSLRSAGNSFAKGATNTFSGNSAIREGSAGSSWAFTNGFTVTDGTLIIATTTKNSAQVNLNGGVTSLQHTNAISTGTIAFGGGTLQYSGSNTVDYSSRIQNSTGAISIDTNGQAVTYATALASSNTGGLTKLGAGTLTLQSAAANGYTGTTTIGGGTLVLDFANATTPTDLIANTSALVLGGGALQVKQKSATATSQTFAGTSLTAGASSVIGTQVTSGALTVNLGSLTRAAGATVNFTLPIGGSITTTAANNAAGILGGYATVGGVDWAVSAGDGTNAGAISALSSYTALTSAGDTTATNNDILSDAGTTTLAGAVSVNSLKFNTAGTLSLNGNNVTLNGSQGGLLVTASGGAITGSGIVGSGAANEFIVNTAGSNSFTIASQIIGDGGTGGLTKSGSGTLTLSALNNYTGTTTVASGTLTAGVAQSGTAGAFGSNSAVVLANAAGVALNLNNLNETIGSLSGGGTTGGNVLLGTATLTVGGDNTSPAAFGGSITGSGGLTKTGTGTLSLSGSSSYTGATTVSGGAVAVQSAKGLGSTSSITVANGAALQLQGGITTGTATTINGAGVTGNAKGAIENLGGINTYSGLITLGSSAAIGSDAGTLLLTNTGTITGVGYTLTLTGAGNGTISSIIGTGTGGLIMAGSGVWTLAGANTFTGAVTINSGGTLAISNAKGLGSSTGVTVANGGALQIVSNISTTNATPITISGAGVAGNEKGAIENVNGTAAAITGLVTLSGNATIGSDTGSLALTNTGTITGAGYTLTLTGSGNGSISSILGMGTGGLTMNGMGMWTLSAASTYTGATTVSSGTLAVNGSLAAGSTVGIGASGMLSGTGTINGVVNNSGNISGSLTFNNDLTISYGATASATAFKGNIVNNGLISSAFTVQSGKTLSGGGTVSGAVVNSGTITGGLTFNNDVTVNSGATAAAAAFNGNIVDNGTITGGLALQSGKTLSGSGSVSGGLSVTSGTVNGSNLAVTGTTTFHGASTLAGSMSSSNGIHVAASGTLNVTGQTASSVNVDNAILKGTGTVGNVVLASGTLNGTLSTGAIRGTGLVSPGGSPGILTASSVTSNATDGLLNFAFELTTQTPNYANASDSLNDVLRITSSDGLSLGEGTNISVYFASLADGARFDGGFFVDNMTTDALMTAISSATFAFYVQDALGTTEFNGVNYSLVDNSRISISAVSATAGFATGSASGAELEFAVVPEPSTWAMIVGGFGVLAFGQRLRRRTAKN